jgi:hypothetical protein
MKTTVTRETREAGKIRELITTPTLKIDGHVTIDLLDDRGKVVSREEAPNYVNTAIWQRYAKYAQKAAFMNQLQGAIVTLDQWNKDPRVTPALFADTLACWNDTTVENSADKYCFGEPIAWAHRYGQGTLSTRQGLSNPLAHEISENALKWVFEWATTNGNGTFQSVGWRRVNWAAATGDPVVCDFPNISRRYVSGHSNTVFVANNASEVVDAFTNKRGGHYYNAADTSIYVIGISTASAFSCVRWPVTFSNGSYTVGTPVNMTADAKFAAGAIVADGATASSTRQTNGFTRLGAGDWIGVGSTGSATTRRPWIRRVTNAGAVTYTNVNAGVFTTESTWLDVTYDGTDIYVVGAVVAGSARRIYRVNPADGAVSATITVSGFPSVYATNITNDATTRGFTGIEWDATNGWLWVTTSTGHTFNVNTSGVWQGVMLTYSTTPNLVLAAPTAAGTAAIYSGELSPNGVIGPTDVEGFAIPHGSTLSGSANTLPGWPTLQFMTNAVPVSTTQFGQRLISMDGDIWQPINLSLTAGYDTANSAVAFGAITSHANFFSRSLLGSPVVKTSSNAMRIAYEMVFS